MPVIAACAWHAGLGVVEPALGIAALAAALRGSAAAWQPQLVACPFEWPKLMAGATHIFPLFSEHALAATTSRTVAGADDQPTAQRRNLSRTARGKTRSQQQPAAATAEAAESALRRVIAVVAGVLGREVDAKQPLMDAGLDSLGAVELRNALGSEFGIDLPATVTFDYPSVSELADFLAGMRPGRPDLGCAYTIIFHGREGNRVALVYLTLRVPCHADQQRDISEDLGGAVEGMDGITASDAALRVGVGRRRRRRPRQELRVC